MTGEKPDDPDIEQKEDPEKKQLREEVKSLRQKYNAKPTSDGEGAEFTDKKDPTKKMTASESKKDPDQLNLITEGMTAGESATEAANVTAAATRGTDTTVTEVSGDLSQHTTQALEKQGVPIASQEKKKLTP